MKEELVSRNPLILICPLIMQQTTKTKLNTTTRPNNKIKEVISHSEEGADEGGTIITGRSVKYVKKLVTLPLNATLDLI